MERINIVHPIEPVYDENSRILILGSFPSVRSREAGFFYGHPQNRFWKVIGAVAGEPAPGPIPERREYLLRHRIALWDVIGKCSIVGSSDTSVRDVVPNDLTKIIECSGLTKVFVNGKLAEKMYRKYTEPLTGIRGIYLPSTSPANAAWRLDDLIKKWKDVIGDISET